MSVDTGWDSYIQQQNPPLAMMGEEEAYRAGYAQCLADIEEEKRLTAEMIAQTRAKAWANYLKAIEETDKSYDLHDYLEDILEYPEDDSWSRPTICDDCGKPAVEMNRSGSECRACGKLYGL